MFIYLARPIDQASGYADTRLIGANMDVQDAIYKQGHAAYRPAQAYALPKSPWSDSAMAYVDAINQFAMARADGVIAILLPDIPTMGTIVEIEQSLAAGTPTCIVTTEALRQRSVQLAGWAARGAEIVFCSEEGRITGLDITSVLVDKRQARQLLDVTGFDVLVPEYVEGRVVAPGDLQVVYMDPAAKPLQRAHPTDAGLDLATLLPAILDHGVRTLLRTGVQAPPPEGWWGLIKPRSSTQARGIQVNEAVIDAGYQGELMISVTLIDPARSRIEIEAGSRLAQYILLPTFSGKVAEVSQFGPSLRGDRGWGSSGE